MGQLLIMMGIFQTAVITFNDYEDVIKLLTLSVSKAAELLGVRSASLSRLIKGKIIIKC